MEFPDDKVLIPTYQALIGCPRCGSRNTRVFPDVHFMEDDFPQKASNFIYIQGQCNDCKTLLLVGIRQYMIDVTISEPNPPEKVTMGSGGARMVAQDVNGKVTEYGSVHFAGTCVDVGGESARADEEDAEPEPRCEWCGAVFHSNRGLMLHKHHCHYKPAEEIQREQEEEEALERGRRLDKGLGMDYEDDDDEEEEVIEKKRSDLNPCSICGNRDGEECLAGLAPDSNELSCVGYDPTRNDAEEEEEQVLDGIKYTKSDETLVNLVSTYGKPRMTLKGMHEGAFKKRLEICPHCEYERKKWLEEKLIKEIMLIVDMEYGPIIEPEAHAVVIFKCPRCGKSNIGHYRLTELLNYDFIDKDIIRKEIVRRGLDSKKERTELDEDISLARLQQRIMEQQAALDLGMDDDIPDDIPDFTIPCGGSKHVIGDDGLYTGEIVPCDVILTPKNSNPRWMTAHHLVVRCPNCHHQRPINDELDKSARTKKRGNKK